MGNHEFCLRCHASDFHYGRTCEQAYPEELKQRIKDDAKLDKTRQTLETLADYLEKVLGFRPSIETFSEQDVNGDWKAKPYQIRIGFWESQKWLKKRARKAKAKKARKSRG